MAEKKEHSSEHHESSKKRNVNFWMIATIVLVILLLGTLIYNSLTTISAKKAGQLLTTFAESQGVTLDVTKVVSKDGFYEVTAEIQGQSGSFYITKDGKYFTSSILPITSSSASANTDSETAVEVPKSEKPKVELFIMSYCPYGTQMEKAILPVLTTLGSKVDATIRFTHFTLHGEKEDTENFRQICIRQEQPTKFLAYLQCTLNSTDPNSPADPTACMNKLSINVAGVNSCIKSKAADYYKVDSDLSQSYGVQGSPTLVINGVQANVARSPAAILEAVCAAYNNAPSECSTQLPTAQASAGFGYSASSSSDTAAAQC